MDNIFIRIMILLLLAAPASFSRLSAAFVDVTIEAGLNAPLDKTFGNATWVDFNNDGL